MKKLLCLCLFIAHVLSAHSSMAPNTGPIVEERHHLFILGVLSYLHHRSERDSIASCDIAALLAWDVEDLDHTPEFVIDRNRNFEKQGNIFHAEIMTIQKAGLKKFENDHSGTSDELHQQYSRRLVNTTLYSSLEPCPFCTMGITLSRIPKVIYFMEDPGIRDHKTYCSLFSFPNEILGRKLTQLQPSSLPFALKVNQEIRDLLFQDPPGKYIVTFPDGRTSLNFGRYFNDQREGWLKLGHELFCSYEVKYDQNKELFSHLIKAIELDD